MIISRYVIIIIIQICNGLPVFENDAKLGIRSKILKNVIMPAKKKKQDCTLSSCDHSIIIFYWIRHVVSEFFQLLKIFNFMSNTRYLDWCSKQKSRKIYNFHIFMYIWLEWGTRRSMGFPTSYWTPSNSFLNPRTKDWCACNVKVISITWGSVSFL